MKFLQLARGWCMGLIDRESHVPSGWTEDPDRCRPAGDFEIEFATKPVLAQRMLAGAIEAACRSPVSVRTRRASR